MKKTLLLLLICALSFSAWGTTVVKTVPDLATAYSWENTTNPFHAYQSFKLDDNITVTANSNTTAGTSTGNMNGIYSGGKWYVYAVDNNGSFTISAKEGYIIQTISIQYGVGNTGVLSSKITATPPTATADQITTGTPVVVNAPSATFYVGNTGNSTAGRLTINAFAVTYCIASAVGDDTFTEKFDNCGTTGSSYTAGPSSIVGDYGVYKWKLTSYRRQPGASSDEINGEQGIRINYGGSIASDGNLEGGIKSVAFNWHPTSGSLISDFYVKVGAESYHHSCSAVSGTFPFSQDFNVTKNTTLSIEVASKIGTSGQAYQVIGPVTITPYLLFKSKSYEYDYSAKQSLALSDIIINNTGTPTPSYAISGGAQATLSNGVVTFAEEEETFTITATWGAVSTTTNITVHALPHPTFTIADVEATMYDETAVPSPIVKVGDVVQSNPVITYASSDENIVKVENEGKELSILAAGEVTITANLKASSTYQAAQTTFTLTVSGIQESDAKVIIETYEGLTEPSGGWYSGVVNYTGKQGYEWSVKYYQFGGHKVGDADAVRLAQHGNDGYISAIVEGGAKALAFDWMLKGVAGQFASQISMDDKSYMVSYASGVPMETPYHCEIPLEVKKNATLKIANGIGTIGSAANYGPITIVPYLLFKNKNLDFQYSETQSVTLSDIIINNTGTPTPSYAISGGAQATLSNGVVTFAEEEETFTITATWGDVSTTTNITVHALPHPTFTIEDVVATMYAGTATPTPVVKVGDVVQSNPEITYTSSDENIVKVEKEGKVLSILAAGSVTITANLKASTAYQAAETTFTLDVTGIQEGDANKVTEEFGDLTPAYNNWSSNTVPDTIQGDHNPYEWTVLYYKYDDTKDDLKVNGNAGVMLASSSLGHIAATMGENIPMEGGIKAVGFDWMVYTGKNAISFAVTAGNVTKNVSYTGKTAGDKGRFEGAFEQKSNVNFQLTNTGINDVYGPITIVPYLLYTEKEVAMWAKDGAYTNSALINNTGETPTFTLEDNDGEATIDATGAVTALKDGEVTVKASWNEGKVYTTYTLKLHLEAPEASFAVSEVEKSIGDEVFINELTKSEYAGTVSYSSSDETVATVNATGEVTIINGGTAKITASITASAACRDTSLYYTLDVMDTPAESTYWEETFSKCPMENTQEMRQVIGDSAVYNWSLTNFQRSTSDMVDDKQGMRLRYPSVWTMTNPEGGIKEVVFDWIASGKDMPVHFFVAAGTNEYEYTRDKVGVNNKIMHFARQFNEPSNVALTLHMSGAQETPQQTYAVVGPIKIVPYLLFTKKNLEYQYTATQSLDLSTIIINNTGATPSYSISDGASATIEDGVVKFANKEESFTVTATWGEVSTTTTIAVHALPIPTFTIANVEASMYDGTATPNPDVKVGDVVQSNPVITYASSDENIVKVENEGKELSILAAGSVTITANLKASETYQAATTTFTLTVSGIQESDANKVIESYTKLTQSGGWSSSTNPVTFDGDNTPYSWEAFYYQYYPTNVKLNINDAAGIMLATGTGYLSATIEGGVKAIAFDWKIYEGKNSINTELYAGETLLKTMNYANLTAGTTNRYECALEQKSNVVLKVLNKSQNDVYGPITIVPYLLYTVKEDTIEVGQTFTNEALINNLGEETITYSIVSGSEYATIDGDEITATAEGDVVVKASWNEDQIYTTYTVHVNPMSALVISEDDENLATLVEEKEGQTLDVTLQRTMVADGAYSTIFLPFAMSTTQIAAVFGEGTQVAQLLSSELVGDLLTFNFDFVTEMSAGVPYLINPTQNVSEANIANVTIVKPEEPVTVEEGKFHGILAKQPAMDIDGLYFLGDDNILVTYPEIHEQEVQGLRAYFTLANPTPQLVARCVIGHTHPTILPLVDGKPVVGVKKVIMNNQMVIIRNTEMYNAQGNKIQ